MESWRRKGKRRGEKRLSRALLVIDTTHLHTLTISFVFLAELRFIAENDNEDSR